jgi:hypothetical protein
MPATSDKQKRFMDAAAHNPAFAKKAGVPVSVAKDFSEKSKSVKFGGSKTRPDLQKVNEPKTRQGKTELFNKGGDMKESKAMVSKEIGFMKKAGAPKSMIKHEKSEMGMKKMASGGMTAALAKHAGKPASKAHAGLKDGGMTKMGSVKTSSKPDGVVVKGKTKGAMIEMKSGGRAC